jgi:hypothetical protein
MFVYGWKFVDIKFHKIGTRTSPGSFRSRFRNADDDACDGSDVNDEDAEAVVLVLPACKFMMWSDRRASSSSFGRSTRMKTCVRFYIILTAIDGNKLKRVNYKFIIRLMAF